MVRFWKSRNLILCLRNIIPRFEQLYTNGVQIKIFLFELYTRRYSDLFTNLNAISHWGFKPGVKNDEFLGPYTSY